MAARPCPISLTGCPGVDAPITNVSAEAPDPLLFAAVVYPTFDPYRPPILGNGPVVDDDCGSLLTSIFAAFDPVVYAGTQLMADLQAQAIELGCAWPPDGSDVDQNDPTQVYMNEERTATVYCPNGTAFTYTVAAGTVVSPPINASLGVSWQQWANDWAQSYAEAQASLLMACLDPTPDPVPIDIDPPPPPPGINRPSIPTGPGILPTPGWMCFGEPWFNRYTISGRSADAYTMSVSAGALPPGVTFTQDGPQTGYVSGTPTAPGQYNFTIQGISTTLPGFTVTVTDYLFVMGITNASSFPDGQIADPYSETLSATGGTAPYSFALDVGSSLPGGLALGDNDGIHNGQISGTPNAAGDFTFDIVLTDANGGECVQTVLMSVLTECAGFPTTIGDMDWTATTIPNPLGAHQHASGSMSGGSGSANLQLDYIAPFQVDYQVVIFFSSHFCNPTGVPITLTATVSNVYGGNVFTGGSLVNTFSVETWKDGVFQNITSADVVTELPNPVAATVTIPAHSTSEIWVYLLLFCAPATPAGFVSAASTITIT